MKTCCIKICLLSNWVVQLRGLSQLGLHPCCLNESPYLNESGNENQLDCQLDRHQHFKTTTLVSASAWQYKISTIWVPQGFIVSSEDAATICTSSSPGATLWMHRVPTASALAKNAADLLLLLTWKQFFLISAHLFLCNIYRYLWSPQNPPVHWN